MEKNKLTPNHLKVYSFKKDCIVSDKILKSKNSNIITTSIRSLHLVKDHPDYKNYLTNYSIFLIIFNTFKRLLLSIFNSFSSIKNLRSKDLPKKQVIFISHLINRNNIFNKNDFYYGNLQEILKRNKISNMRILLNHVNSSQNFQINRLKKDTLIFNNILDFKSELKIIYLQFVEFTKLVKRYFNCKDNIEKKIIKRALRSVFEYQTTFALRTSYQLEKAIKLIDPKIFICTYEGYSWERLCFKTLKNYSKNITCLGYHHTPIIKSNYAIKRNLKNNYDPDFIWCSNKNSFNELLNSKKLKKKQIFNLGSPKEINEKNINIKIKISKTCLVIPEGTYPECLKLFNFSLMYALNHSSFKFIWRAHPIIDLKKLLSFLKISPNNLPKNISISRNYNIKKDMMKTSFVLYRGSGAVIDCISNGLTPIYLNIQKNVNIDPIYKIKTNNYVTSIQDFKKLTDLHINKKRLNYNLSRKINNNHLQKLKINKLIKFINKFK